MPKPNVSDIRIPQILAAAARVFSKFGIDKANMIQIAQEANISKASIYHYFNSKDDMIKALVDQLFKVDTESLTNLVSQSGSVKERLLNYTQNLAFYLESNKALFPIFAESRVLALRNNNINQILSDYYKNYISAFTAMINQGVQSEELSINSSPHDLAFSITSLIEGIILLSLTLDINIQEAMQDGISTFLAEL